MESDIDFLRNQFGPVAHMHLPFGVYLVTRDGQFVECNARMREMLQLPKESPILASVNIGQFYFSEEERIKAMALADAKPDGEFLEQYNVPLFVSGRRVWVERWCRTIRCPGTDIVIGYLGFVADITEEENFRRLFDDLPAGVYRLDSENVIARANLALVQLMRCAAEKTLTGKPVSQIWADPEEYKKFDQMMLEKGQVVDEICELVRETGEKFFGSVTARTVWGANGSYRGREGTVVDVTAQESHRRLLDSIPVGTFMVRCEKGKDIVHNWNRAYAKMFELDGIDPGKGMDVAELFADPEHDLPALRDEIKKSHDRKQFLTGYPLKVKTALTRRVFTVSVNNRALTDSNGNIIGRAGVVRDISGEIALREIGDSAGRVLHRHIGTLMMFSHSAQAVVKALAGEDQPIEGIPDIPESWSYLKGPANELEDSLKRLLEKLRVSPSTATIGFSHLAVCLERNLLNLQNVTSTAQFPEQVTTDLNAIVRSIVDSCTSLMPFQVSREEVRDTRAKAETVECLCCMIEMRRLYTQYLAVYNPLRAFCEYLHRQPQPPEPRGLYLIAKLITSAIGTVQSYAKNERVDLKRTDETKTTRVLVHKDDVVRALENLLHNAVKYSWARGRDGRRWVSIVSYLTGTEIWIEIENYGVPIMDSELQNDLIFEPGYRGVLSSDRYRTGSGFGLYDARQVARAHDGDLILASRPALASAKQDDYTVPFLTKATFRLPYQ